jgi:hypothetical protein
MPPEQKIYTIITESSTEENLNMIGQKSSPGLGLRRAWTWGSKATWRKNWTATLKESFKGAKAGRLLQNSPSKSTDPQQTRQPQPMQYK